MAIQSIFRFSIRSGLVGKHVSRKYCWYPGTITFGVERSGSCPGIICIGNGNYRHNRFPDILEPRKFVLASHKTIHLKLNSLIVIENTHQFDLFHSDQVGFPF